MNLTTFVSSNKGGNILVGSHQFEYRKRKAVGSTVYYVCREAERLKCKATASTIETDGVIYIKVQKGIEAIENAAKNPTVAPRTILADMSNTVQSESMAAASSLSMMNSMKQAIYRARRKEQGVMDRLPSTPEDLLNLDAKFQNLQSDKKFLVSQKRLDEESVIFIL